MIALPHNQTSLTLSVMMAGLLLAGCREERLTYSAKDDGRQVAHPEKAPMERCYGIARAGQNDGISGAEKKGADGPGTSQKDWQGNAWKYVEAGSCETYGTDVGPALPEGRRGSLTPLGRDAPE